MPKRELDNMIKVILNEGSSNMTRIARRAAEKASEDKPKKVVEVKPPTPKDYFNQLKGAAEAAKRKEEANRNAPLNVNPPVAPTHEVDDSRLNSSEYTKVPKKTPVAKAVASPSVASTEAPSTETPSTEVASTETPVVKKRGRGRPPKVASVPVEVASTEAPSTETPVVKKRNVSKGVKNKSETTKRIKAALDVEMAKRKTSEGPEEKQLSLDFSQEPPKTDDATTPSNVKSTTKAKGGTKPKVTEPTAAEGQKEDPEVKSKFADDLLSNFRKQREAEHLKANPKETTEERRERMRLQAKELIKRVEARGGSADYLKGIGEPSVERKKLKDFKQKEEPTVAEEPKEVPKGPEIDSETLKTLKAQRGSSSSKLGDLLNSFPKRKSKSEGNVPLPRMGFKDFIKKGKEGVDVLRPRVKQAYEKTKEATRLGGLLLKKKIGGTVTHDDIYRNQNKRESPNGASSEEITPKKTAEWLHNEGRGRTSQETEGASAEHFQNIVNNSEEINNHLRDLRSQQSPKQEAPSHTTNDGNDTTEERNKREKQDAEFDVNVNRVKAEVARREQAIPKAKTKSKTKAKEYRIRVHAEGETGGVETHEIVLPAENHFHAIEKARNLAATSTLKNPKIGGYNRIR